MLIDTLRQYWTAFLKLWMKANFHMSAHNGCMGKNTSSSGIVKKTYTDISVDFPIDFDCHSLKPCDNLNLLKNTVNVFTL